MGLRWCTGSWMRTSWWSGSEHRRDRCCAGRALPPAVPQTAAPPAPRRFPGCRPAAQHIAGTVRDAAIISLCAAEKQHTVRVATVISLCLAEKQHTVRDAAVICLCLAEKQQHCRHCMRSSICGKPAAQHCRHCQKCFDHLVMSS